ncbi:unnamed protein product [Urochloa humidicola]
MQNLTEVARSKNLLLKVEGHSVTTAMGDGEFIKSSRWIVGGHKWEIHLRPKDHWAGRHRPVTLKLVLLSEPHHGGTGAGDVKAKLTCRLIDPAGALPPSDEKTVAHKFHRVGDYSGPAVVTAREELEASGCGIWVPLGPSPTGMTVGLGPRLTRLWADLEVAHEDSQT